MESLIAIAIAGGGLILLTLPAVMRDRRERRASKRN